MIPIADVDPNCGPDSCPQEPIEPYIRGEGLNPNNFVAEDQSVSKFVLETQPNDRKRPNFKKCKCYCS